MMATPRRASPSSLSETTAQVTITHSYRENAPKAVQSEASPRRTATYRKGTQARKPSEPHTRAVQASRWNQPPSSRLSAPAVVGAVVGIVMSPPKSPGGKGRTRADRARPPLLYCDMSETCGYGGPVFSDTRDAAGYGAIRFRVPDVESTPYRRTG